MRKKQRKILIGAVIIGAVLILGFLAFQNKNLFGLSLYSSQFPVLAGYNWGKGLPEEYVYQACNLVSGDNGARLVPGPTCPIIFQLGTTVPIKETISNYQVCGATLSVLTYKWQSFGSQPPPCVWNDQSPPVYPPDDAWVQTTHQQANGLEGTLHFVDQNAFTISYTIPDVQSGNINNINLNINNNFKDNVDNVILIFWLTRQGLFGKEEVLDLSPSTGISLAKGTNNIPITLPADLPEGKYKAHAFLGDYRVTDYSTQFVNQLPNKANYKSSMIPLTNIIDSDFNVLFNQPQGTSTTTVPQVGGVCKTDTKQCPDGTYVARDPNNNCQFRQCSNKPADYTSIIIIAVVVIIITLLIFLTKKKGRH